MRSFRCACGARIFFENETCLSCGRALGFVVPRLAMSAVEPAEDGSVTALVDGARYRRCANDEQRDACNWLVSVDDPQELCRACRLNRVVPDLSWAENRDAWARVEVAKRRLLYSLFRLRLPVPDGSDPGDRLAFDIKAESAADGPVITGHADGLITLNLAEADPVLREKARAEMEERYRTLLGHFRHEIGHYYWDRLVRDGGWLEAFRECFGDERADYARALERHYAEPPTAWQGRFISAYASAHPWEDWAETWAHHLHIHDTLETARHFGVGAAPDGDELPVDEPFESVLEAWAEVTVALTAMNRSMGLPDPYPFQIRGAVRDKLALVDRIVRSARGAS